MAYGLTGRTRQQLDEREKREPGFLQRLSDARVKRMRQYNKSRMDSDENLGLSPRDEIFALIAKNDGSEECEHAKWRADQLFGDSWKKKKK